MRGAGWLHSMVNRLVMCGLIWLPSPRMKRPLEKACRSQPMLASVIGLRANATAIDVPSSSVRCARRRAAAGRTGRGWSPRSTRRCSRRPRSPWRSPPALARSLPIPPSTFIAPTVVPASLPVRCPGLARSGVLVAEEALELGGELVAGRDAAGSEADRSAAWPGRRAPRAGATIARCSSLPATSWSRRWRWMIGLLAHGRGVDDADRRPRADPSAARPMAAG